MNWTKRIGRWRHVLPAALVAILLAVAALPMAAAAQRADRPDLAARLTERLELTDQQQAQVEDVLAENEGRAALWSLAATLQSTLTDEQKDALYAHPERGGKRQGEGRRGRRDRDGQSEEAHADRAEVMRGALGLTDEQVEALEALREERRAERSGPPPLPAAVVEILSPEQQEIMQIHRALARHMHGPHRGGHHGQRRGRR